MEETLRLIQQSDQLADLRVLCYQRLRKLAALVMASAYFGAAWLGTALKRAGRASRVLKVARRCFGVPAFPDYAWADGIGFLLSRLRLTRLKSTETPQLSLFPSS